MNQNGTIPCPNCGKPKRVSRSGHANVCRTCFKELKKQQGGLCLRCWERKRPKGRVYCTHCVDAYSKTTPPPTEQEIEAMCAEFRKERPRQQIGHEETPYMIPVIQTAEIALP